jgi:hypothetical protein
VASNQLTFLNDLRQIDARARLRCDVCGRETVHDRETLIRAAGPLPVELATYRLSCAHGACEGWAYYVGAIPWCDDESELRRRVFSNTLLNLACQVLKNAAYRRVRNAEQQAPVRLALRVVQSFGAEAAICSAYWTKVTDANPTPWDSCHNEVNWIVLALLRRGWSINAELRL